MVAVTWEQYAETRSIQDRNKLIEQYYPIVQKVALSVYRRVRGFGSISVDELASFGAIGLIEAVERFNPAVQLSFEGYAQIRIRGAIIDEIRASSWVPRSIKVKEQAYNRALDDLTIELNRNPTDQEIMAKLKMTEAEYRRFMVDAVTRSVRSLDAEMGDDGTLSLHDLIPDVPLEESNDRTEVALELINGLPLRERIILRLFYIEGLSFPEIADLMAFGESRASQIHSSALEMLRKEGE